MKVLVINSNALLLLVPAWILDCRRQVGVNGEAAGIGLADPASQDLFTTEVPNPLDPSFLYDSSSGILQVSVSGGTAETGLNDNKGIPLSTPIWGYGVDDDIGHTWPARTFVVKVGTPLYVRWLNKLSVVSVNVCTRKSIPLSCGQKRVSCCNSCFSYRKMDTY
jgi:hypothetical protein